MQTVIRCTGLLLSLLLLGLGMRPVLAESDTSAPSYSAALKQMQAKQGESRFSEHDRAVMARSAEALAVAMPDPGIKVGERAPDFTLPNAFGDKISLSAELEKGPVVLVFYRGAWCPFCNLHLHVLQQSLPEFKRHGAQLITITPQQPDRSAEQIKKDGYPFEVLSDLDNSVMKSYQLYYELDPELVAVYKKHGLDIGEYNGPGRTVLPIPGSFVIDRNGIVRAMHAETDYKQRMEPAKIIEALKNL